MSFRMRIRVLIDVILRVPPLFLIDELLRIGLGLSSTQNETDPLPQGNFTAPQIPGYNSYDAQFYAYVALTILKFTASFIGKYKWSLCLCLGAINFAILALANDMNKYNISTRCLLD